MRNELLGGAWADGSVSAVLFPAVLFPAELLHPLPLEHNVNCTFRILHDTSFRDRLVRDLGLLCSSSCAAVGANQRVFRHCRLAVLTIYEADLGRLVGWSFAWRDNLQYDFFGGYVGSSVDGDDAFDLPLDIVDGGHKGGSGACGDGNAEFEGLCNAVG